MITSWYRTKIVLVSEIALRLRPWPRPSWAWLASLMILVAGCDQGEEKPEDDAGAKVDKKRRGKKKKKKKKRKKSPRASASASTAAEPDGSVPPPTPGMRITPRVGSWATYATDSPTEGKGGLEWRVIAEPQPKRYRIELVMSNATQKFLTEANMTAVDLRDPDGHVFHEFRFREPGGPIMAMPAGMAPMVRNTVKQFFVLANPAKLEGAPQEDVTVKAGVFRGCYKIRGKGVAYGVEVDATHWVHPAVPLPGVIKTSAQEGTMELSAYGTTGAKSHFDGP